MTQHGAVQTGLGRRHSYMSEEPFCQPEALYCQYSFASVSVLVCTAEHFLQCIRSCQ